MNTQSSKQEARERLLDLVKPGDTIYTILRHVSRSGMQRVIDLIVLTENRPRSIAYQASVLTDTPLDRDRWGVKVRGAGMDMGFAVVYDLSYKLFPGGFGCTGEHCPSNDHSNGDGDYTPHMTDEERTGASGELCTCHKNHMHKDGGYALLQRWM